MVGPRRSWSLVAASLGAGLACPFGAAHAATRAESVQELMKEDRYEDAQKKCDKWEASSLTAEADLRLACADAWWPVYEARNTATDWARYRATWKGTAAADDDAREREAAAVLRTLPLDVSEADLLGFAGLYKGTLPEGQFRRQAADVAVRLAEDKDSDTAVAVARRYPDHAGLGKLVERFPDAFLVVNVEGRRVEVTLDPPVNLPWHLRPRVDWVAREPNGVTRTWDEAMVDYLARWGVPATVPGRFEAHEPGQPGVPVCWGPGHPPGWGPAVVISVGTGSITREVAWDEGCGPDAWPVFMTVFSGRVAALSLAPGHLVELTGTTSGPADRDDVRAWVTIDPDAAVVLFEGGLYRRAAGAWVVQPLAGGAPWSQARGPGEGGLPLSADLLTAGFPTGWHLVPQPDGIVVDASQAPGGPGADPPWRLLPGDIRLLSPLVQRVMGLAPAGPLLAAVPTTPPVRTAGWSRDERTGRLLASPPEGADPAGLAPMQEPEVEAALDAAAAAGLGAGAFVAQGGWWVDLDDDGLDEAVLRTVATRDGIEEVVLMVVDGARRLDGLADEAGDVDGADSEAARLFTCGTPRRAGSPGEVVFAFRSGGHTHLAWGGQDRLSSSLSLTWIEILSSDGRGFVVEGVELP